MATPGQNEKRIEALEDCIKGLTKRIADEVRRTNTYLNLYDTSDETYEGVEGFSPVVRNLPAHPLNPYKPNSLRLERLVGFNDLYPGNAVIYGGITLADRSERTYYVWASAYIINGILYASENDFVSGVVTLNASPSGGESRFDVFAIRRLPDTQVGAREEAEIVVIEGDPDVSPLKPTLDLEIEVEVGFKLLTSDETQPPEIINEQIYLDNAGEPGEWNNTVATLGINVGFTPPLEGTFSVFSQRTVNAPRNVVTWENDAPLSWDNDAILHFNLRINEGWDITFTQTVNNPGHIDVTLISAGRNVGTFQLFRNNALDYGIVPSNISDVQYAAIPFADFTTFERDPVDYDAIQFEFIDMPECELDDIYIQTGVEGPGDPIDVIETFIELNDTPNAYAGNGNRYLKVNQTESGVEFDLGPIVYEKTVFVDANNGSDVTGQYERKELPFQTVDAALSALPTPSNAQEEEEFDGFMFHVVLLSDDTYPCSAFTKHSLSFESEYRCTLAFSNDLNPGPYKQDCFTSDSDVRKEIRFIMPVGEVTCSSTADIAAIVRLQQSTVFFNLRKLTVNNTNASANCFGIYSESGYAHGRIQHLETNSSGIYFLPSNLSDVNSNIFQQAEEYGKRQLIIERLDMTNDGGDKFERTGITYGASRYTIEIEVFEAWGPDFEISPEYNAIFNITGNTAIGTVGIQIRVHSVNNIGLYFLASNARMEFVNAIVNNSGIGRANKSTIGGGIQHTGQINVLSVRPGVMSRFHFYDYFSVQTTERFSFAFRRWAWSVKIMRVRAVGDFTEQEYKDFSIFNAPSGFISRLASAYSSFESNDEWKDFADYLLGDVFIDAQIYNCPVRIFKYGSASAVITGQNAVAFAQNEVTYFFGDCYFDGNGEFFDTNSANQRGVVVYGSLKLGPATPLNTAKLDVLINPGVEVTTNRLTQTNRLNHLVQGFDYAKSTVSGTLTPA